MRKVLIISLVLFAIPAMGLATNEGNGNGNGGPEGNEGSTQGPTGPQGLPGMNGTNGTNGKDGKAGINGLNGKDGANMASQWRGTDLNGELAVRLFDTKYVQGQFFDQYTFGSEPSQDVFGAGHNSVIGGRLVLKLGSSYEQRENEALKRRLEALEAVVAHMQ